MKNIKEQRLKRSKIEQEISAERFTYCVEDERFLYYSRDGKNLHISKGDSDLYMPIDDWKIFAETMLRVSDEYFVTGEGRKMDNMLSWLLSKYSRRKEFAGGLLEIIEDASTWAYA